VVGARSAPILDFMAANRFRRASDEQLHLLRIAAKKLRYSLEIFDEVWPAGLKPHIAQSRAVQDVIGQYHDWCVLGERIDREIRRTTRNDANHLAFQLGRLRSQVSERKTALRREILPKLKELEAGLRPLVGASTGPRAPAGVRVKR
jgi:CHAD domain-containing protein